MTATTIEAPNKGVLSEPNMRWYFGGQLVSIMGTMLQSAVLSLLIISIVSKEQAASCSGVNWALGFLPGIFLAPFAGIVLDRLDKRRILTINALMGTLQALSLAYLTYTHQITIWQIYVLAFLMGFVNAIDGPGRQAIIKDSVVDQRNVRQAVKIFMAMFNVAQIVGPGFAGYLVIKCGYPFTFVLNALSFIALIVALANMKLVLHSPNPKASEATEKLGIWKQVIEGGRYTFSEPAIRLCIILSTGLCVFGFSYYLLLAIIAKYMLHGDPIVYSHLAADQGLGLLAGAIVALASHKWLSHKTLIIGGMILAGISLLFLSRTTNANQAMPWIFLAGAGVMASFSTLRSSMVHISKKEASGIVQGYSYGFFYGSMMIAGLTLGPLADHFGCPLVLIISGIAVIAIALVTPFIHGINKLE